MLEFALHDLSASDRKKNATGLPLSDPVARPANVCSSTCCQPLWRFG